LHFWIERSLEMAGSKCKCHKLWHDFSGKQVLFLFRRKLNAVSKPQMSVFIPFSTDAFSNLP
jgi:hypothetical protein